MFTRSLFAGVLALALMTAGAANAQCFTTQLDYDFRLGLFDEVLGGFLIDPGNGENLWTGDMGSTPLWQSIPGQTGPGFVDADNDGNGIDDDDHLDLLAAVVDGGAATGPVLSALNTANPGAVAAIQAAYAANAATLQGIEISIQNVEVSALGGLYSETVTVTTGTTLVLNPPLIGQQNIDIPSLWSVNETTPEDALLALADNDGLLQQSLIEILSGFTTIGDPDSLDYIQSLFAQVMITVIEVVLPELLNNLKSGDSGFAGAVSIDMPQGIGVFSAGGPKAVTLNCALFSDFNETVTVDNIDADIFIDSVDICNALQAFIDNFSCTTFDCESALLQASGNLNGSGDTNLASYNNVAATTRQAWMGLESILNPPLEITSQTTSISVNVGDPALFEMDFNEGLSGGPQEFRWQAASPPDYALGTIIGTVEDYTLEYPLAADAGTYIGSVCDTSWTRKTLPIPLNVTPVGYAITQQPAAANIAVGDDHTMSVKVNGGTVVPTYQWQKGTSATGPFTNVGGATDKDLDFTNAQPSDSGFYRVLVTGGTGSTVLTSTVAQLQVLPPIVISGQPTGANLIVGENHTLTVTASGGLTSLDYQWQIDTTETGLSFVDIPSANAATLNINPAFVSNQGLYRCSVTDQAVPPQEEFSNQVLVTVLGFTSSPPLNSSLPVGGNLTLTVVPGGGDVSDPGNPAVDYVYSWTKVPGPNPPSATNEVSIVSAVTGDSGAYVCTVTDLAGRMASSAAANVFVTNSPIIISTNPVDTGRATGTSVNFTCVATGGVGALSFEWFFNNGGGDVSLGAGTSITDGSQLTLSGLTQVANQGAYFCRVSDGGSPQVSDSATAQLYVGNALAFQGGTGPVGGDFHTGDSHTVDVAVTGGIGPLTYTWTLDGNTVGPNSAIYNLTPITPLSAGTFQCVINDIGIGDAINGFVPNVITSGTALVRVGAPLQLLAGGQPQGQTVSSGSNVTFTVAPIGGLGTLSYQWFSDAKAPLAGETSDTLTLTNVSNADEGDYYCQITDEIGGAMGDVTSSQASLVVADPLVITQQPLDVSGDEGDGAFMAVAVSGGLTESYSYQWRKDNVNIGGATNNVLSFSPLVAGDEGDYDCVVTDSTESVVSNAAEVTIAASGLPIAGGLGIALLVAMIGAIGAATSRKKK